jgi:1,4-alpha-glucan branching enzyme
MPDCHARPDDKSVRLVGDFNDWDIASLPMQRQPDGCWFVQVPLTHGHHQYVFLVDGEPELDPDAAGIVRVLETAEDGSCCHNRPQQA